MKLTFDQNPREGKDDKSETKPEEGNYVPTRHPKVGKSKVNTLLRKDFQINEVGPQQDYVHYKKPSLFDIPTDKQTRDDLDKLLKENHATFAEDERQIGTYPLIKIPIDTGDHPSIAKKPYDLALKHYDWVREEIDKFLEVGVIRDQY